MYSITGLMKPYVVALRGFNQLSPAQRIQAEVRFATELERIYGGDLERMVSEMGLHSHACQCGSSKREMLCQDWKAVVDKAAKSVLIDLGQAEAYFEVMTSEVA